VDTYAPPDNTHHAIYALPPLLVLLLLLLLLLLPLTLRSDHTIGKDSSHISSTR
jgi:hypothetical protein